MSRIRRRLRRVLNKLSTANLRLAFNKQRVLVLRDRAQRAHGKAGKVGEQADRARAKGRAAIAAERDRRAEQLEARAQKLWARCRSRIQTIKRLRQKRDGLAHTAKELRAELRKWRLEHGVHISGNVVKGGTPRERLKAAALAAAAGCASGKRANFYSQPGSWTVDHAITGEMRGQRSDCSQFVTAIYHSAGLGDPNGNAFRGGYTGTLGSHGKAVSRSQLKPGDLVLYGNAPHHHVEMYVGPGDKTIGHGSAPVDAGTVYMLSGPITLRTYL